MPDAADLKLNRCNEYWIYTRSLDYQHSFHDWRSFVDEQGTGLC